MPILLALSVLAFVALLWATISIAGFVRRARRRRRRRAADAEPLTHSSIAPLPTGPEPVFYTDHEAPPIPAAPLSAVSAAPANSESAEEPHGILSHGPPLAAEENALAESTFLHQPNEPQPATEFHHVSESQFELADMTIVPVEFEAVAASTFIPVPAEQSFAPQLITDPAAIETQADDAEPIAASTFIPPTSEQPSAATTLSGDTELAAIEPAPIPSAEPQYTSATQEAEAEPAPPPPPPPPTPPPPRHMPSTHPQHTAAPAAQLSYTHQQAHSRRRRLRGSLAQAAHRWRRVR